MEEGSHRIAPEMVVAFDEGQGLELKCMNLSPFAKDFCEEEHYNESID